MLNSSVRRFSRRSSILFSAALLCVSLGVVLSSGGLRTFTSAPLQAQEGAATDNIGKEVTRIMERVAKCEVERRDRMWLYALELRLLKGENDEFATGVKSALEAYLDHASEQCQIVAAQVLLTLGADATSTGEVLNDLVESSEDSDLVASAVNLALRFPGEELEELAETIETRLEEADDDELSSAALVAMAEAQVDINPESLGAERLRQWLASDDHELKARSALALDRLGFSDEVQTRLGAVSKEAGELALLARLHVKNHGVLKQITSSQTGTLIEQTITHAVKQSDAEVFYHGLDPLPVNAENLVVNAARGMTGSLDDFSEFLTSEEFKKRMEDTSGNYRGIGARVTKGPEDPAVRVSQPIYGGPGYAAGLRSGDWLWAVKIDGGATVSLEGKEIEDVVKLLRGPKDSIIELTVKRPGETDLVTLKIVRGDVHSDTSEEDMLPGGFGYIQLTSFGKESTNDMFKDLVRLKSMGMKGLVLDLRNNPGGQLPTVLAIANLFLKKNLPLARVYGPHPDYAKQPPYFTRSDALYPDLPLVVLINGNSASGSELLSGALKDHDRALVLGEKSFGKGIGQNYIPMARSGRVRSEADAEFWVKCTVFTYYILPSNTCVDRKDGVGGVTPHIEIPDPLLSSWEFYKLIELRRSRVLEEWVVDQWAAHEQEFISLATYDGYSDKNYPGFDELYASLDTELSRDRIRQELQREIRVRAADHESRQRGFPQAYQSDFQLQRGIIELAKKLEVDPRTIAEYQPFMARHADAIEGSEKR